MATCNSNNYLSTIATSINKRWGRGGGVQQGCTSRVCMETLRFGKFLQTRRKGVQIKK